MNACGHGAITMQPDKEGFILPVIDESKCVDCGLCEKKCPVLQIPQFEEIPHKVYAAYNLNKEQHQKSASGGIFSAFANYFYQLDNGVVCASAFDETMTLRFATSTNKEDLLKFRGSKLSAYLKGWIHRESCYRCPFTGNHRQGDCTICDFWSILSGKKPFGRKTSMGVSMIMTNTVKGEKMFNQIKSQLYFEEKTFEDAIRAIRKLYRMLR